MAGHFPKRTMTDEEREELVFLNQHAKPMADLLRKRADALNEKCLNAKISENDRQYLLGQFHGFRDLAMALTTRQKILAEIAEKERRDV